MRLIDIDAYFENSELMNTEFPMDSVEHGILYDVANELEFAPCIDIVRCKDCKNMLVSDKGFRFCNVWCNINGMGDDGYCNYGERRNNGT